MRAIWTGVCLYDECRPMSINGYCSIVYTLLKVNGVGQVSYRCCGILLAISSFMFFIFDVS